MVAMMTAGTLEPFTPQTPCGIADFQTRAQYDRGSDPILPVLLSLTRSKTTLWADTIERHFAPNTLFSFVVTVTVPGHLLRICTLCILMESLPSLG
jgi:hypothetical protein